MERISRGFRLLGASWRVVKQDRELLVLPAVSMVLTLAAAATFFGIGFSVGDVDITGDELRLEPIHYVVLGLFYFVAYFISIFFNAAVVGAATIRLQGGDPTVGDGLRLARRHVGKIAGWALIAASVGLVLRALEDRAGFVGRIVIGLIGVAWSAITFFVVPVLLYEPESVTGSIKRSAQIFRQRWGEQFTGNLAIGLAMFIIAIPIVILVGALGALAPILAVVVGVAVLGLLAAVGATLSGVFNAALYRYATTGETSAEFSESDLRGTFTPRR